MANEDSVSFVDFIHYYMISPTSELSSFISFHSSYSCLFLFRLLALPCTTIWYEYNISQRKRAKSSITQPWFIRFYSNFVQSLNAWQ